MLLQIIYISTTLKDQKIDISVDKKKLLIKGLGKIKFDTDFEDIKFKIIKIKDNTDNELIWLLERVWICINIPNYNNIYM